MKQLIMFSLSICFILVLVIPTNVVSINITSNTNIKNDYLKNEQTQDKESNFYAVIAACSRYENPGANLPPFSPFPDEKLMVLYDSLLESENWDENNIELLLNENATKENITGALEKMSDIVGPDDVFLFSWQGHGGVRFDDDGDEKANDPKDEYDEVIIPYNTSNFIRDDELDFYFSKIKSKGMCLIFESCFSGGMVDKGKKLDLLVNNNNEREFNVLDVNDENRVVIMSTLSSTVCRASYIFAFPMTYCLARALSGKARDRDKDGFISVEEAFKFARFRAILCSNLYWIFDMGMGFVVALLVGSSNPAAVVLSNFIGMYLVIQLITKLRVGYFMLNWPNMCDDYSGNLPIVKC